MVKKKKTNAVRFKKVSCGMLNVRSQPSLSALVVKMIPINTVVDCDVDYKNDKWDKVFIEPNINGYCMKEFLQPIDSSSILAAFPNHTIVVKSINVKEPVVISEERNEKE